MVARASRLGWLLLALSLASGCRTAPPLATLRVATPARPAAAAGRASLVVRVAPPPRAYHLAYLRQNDWDEAQAVVTPVAGGDAVTITAAAVYDATSGTRTASLAFPDLQANATYRLDVTTRRRTPSGAVATLASVTVPSVSLAEGANAVTAVPEATAEAQPTPRPEVDPVMPSGYVTSFPLEGTVPRFYVPNDLAIDPTDGSMVIADEYNYAIRRVSVDGNGERFVTTVAGAAWGGSSDGPALGAYLGAAYGVDVAPDGTIYVADRSSYKILEIRHDAAGVGTQRTVVSAPGGPIDVVRAPDGTLYFTEVFSHLIKAVTFDGAGTPTVTTIAGGFGFADGPGASARFRNPNGIIRDAAGNLYVCDTGNSRIRKLAPDGAGGWTVSTFAGDGTFASLDGPAASARFKNATNCAIGPDGAFYVAEVDGHRVRKIAPDGAGGWTVSTVAGTGVQGVADGPGAGATLNGPRGLVWHPDGSLYVICRYSSVLRRITFAADGAATVSTAAGVGYGTGLVNGRVRQRPYNIEPYPMAIGLGAGGRVYLADYAHYGPREFVRRADDSWDLVPLAGHATASGYADGDGAAARFSYISDMLELPDGSLLLWDRGRIRRLVRQPDGTTVVATVAGNGTEGTTDGTGSGAAVERGGCLALDRDGSVLLGSGTRIRRLTIGADGVGTIATIAGSATATDADGPLATATFSSVQDLAVDGAGRIVVLGNRVIRRIAPDAAGVPVVTTYTSADINRRAYHLAVASDGAIYVANDDMYNVLKLVIGADGTMTSAIHAGGTGTQFGSSDGPGDVARFFEVEGIKMGADGLLYVMEDSGAIRRVVP